MSVAEIIPYDPLRVHENAPPMPNPSVREPGGAPGERRAEAIVIDTFQIPASGRVLELVAIRPGWSLTGSVIRWDHGCYAFRMEIEGVRHQRRFHDFPSAKLAFDRIVEGNTRGFA